MVTRGRQKSLRYGRTLHCRFARDLPTRVDAISVFEKRSIGAVNKTVEVQHRTVLLGSRYARGAEAAVVDRSVTSADVCIGFDGG